MMSKGVFSTIKLESIRFNGFKSACQEGQKINFKDITIVSGANGKGTSDLPSFFRMLSSMMSGKFQQYAGTDGALQSRLISVEVRFSSQKVTDVYKCELSPAKNGLLVFSREVLSCKGKNRENPVQLSLYLGSPESGLPDIVNTPLQEMTQKEIKTAEEIYHLLQGCSVFQFHDISKEAEIRNTGRIDDSDHLKSNGANLAAFLYGLRSDPDNLKYYDRIVRYVRSIMPQFGDFVLNPSVRDENSVLLNWKENGSDDVLGPDQLPDSALRFTAMATLLLQPEKTLPSVIIIDEPEFGLEPSIILTLGHF